MTLSMVTYLGIPASDQAAAVLANATGYFPDGNGTIARITSSLPAVVWTVLVVFTRSSGFSLHLFADDLASV
jgi:hypothetical protein